MRSLLYGCLLLKALRHSQADLVGHVGQVLTLALLRVDAYVVRDQQVLIAMIDGGGL